jgi:uncharacterized membrane protein YtjA (UPF0391 family)
VKFGNEFHYLIISSLLIIAVIRNAERSTARNECLSKGFVSVAGACEKTACLYFVTFIIILFINVIRGSSNTTAYKCIIFFLGATFCKKRKYILV